MFVAADRARRRSLCEPSSSIWSPGLVDAGVAAGEADRLLEVIGARAATGQTGAAWQRAALTAAGRGRSGEHALAVMLEAYLSRAATGQPVHTWPAVAETRTRTTARSA